MQISYHSVLTKIQKLQNLKKKKLFSVPAGIARNWPIRPVFFPVRNRGVECTGLLAGTVYSDSTGRYGTELITLLQVAIIVDHQKLLVSLLSLMCRFLTIFLTLVQSVEIDVNALTGYPNIQWCRRQFFQPKRRSHKIWRRKKKQRRKGKASRKKKRAPSLTVVIGQITKQRGPKSYGIEQI